MSVQTETIDHELHSGAIEANWDSYCKLGGAAALVLLVYSLVTMLILIVIGGQPGTAYEAFTWLQNNRLIGLLRLDILSIIVMPVYYLLILSLYICLKKTNTAIAALASVLAFAGVTLFLATPSAFSWLSLSDRFASATTDAQKNLFLAAGEAILVSDMWHGSGAIMGGILIQTGMLLLSFIMLSGTTFGKFIAYLGIVMHGLDLLHLVAGLVFPSAGIVFMVIAGPLYLVWFPLIARRFFQLARSK